MAFEISLSPQNPLLSGFISGEQVGKDLRMTPKQLKAMDLANQAQQQKIAQSAQQFPQQMQAGDTTNQLKQAQLQAMTEGLGSDLENKQLQNKYLQARTDALNNPSAHQMAGLQGQLQYAQAVANTYGADSPQAKSAMENYQAQLDALHATTGRNVVLSNTQVGRMMSAIPKAQLFTELNKLGYTTSMSADLIAKGEAPQIVNNQTQYPDYMQQMNQGGAPQQNVPQGTLQQSPQMQPQAQGAAMMQGMMQDPNQQGQMPPQAQQPQPQMQQPQGMQQQDMEQQQPQQMQSQPEQPRAPVPDVSQIAAQELSETQSGIDKATMSSDQPQRIAASTRVIPMLEAMAKDAPLALEYAGLSGKVKKALAAGGQGNDPRYLAYKRFIQSQAGAMADTAVALGTRSTDTGFNEIRPLFNISTWDVSPDQAKNLFNHTIKLIEAETKSNISNIEQQKTTLRNAPQISIPTQDNPQGSMQEGQMPTMPTSINTKAQYQEWFRQQSPLVQQQLIDQEAK